MCLAVPGEVLSINEEDPLMRTGRISFGGVVKEVNLTFVPEAQVGSYVLVHVGFAISTIEPGEAHRVYEYLKQIQGLEDFAQ